MSTDSTAFNPGLPAGCGEPLPLNLSVNTSNRIATNTVAGQVTDYCYDAAGNLIHTVVSPATCPASGPYQYAYNAENHITSTAGVNYSYDGNGNRVMKSNGKLYWYGGGSDPLDETDLAGNANNATFKEYVFFNGTRIASRDSSNNVDYYFADHLGTARVVANAGGTILDDSDFYPFGVERPVVGPSSGNNYKFTGKERDPESYLDNFGARYYASTLARFMSPDPGNFSGLMNPDDPQAWNGYSYVLNNPLKYTDPSGLYCYYGDPDPDSPDRNDNSQYDFSSNPNECGTNGGTWYEDTWNQTVTVTATALPTPSPVFYMLSDMYTSIYDRTRWVGSFTSAFAKNWFTVGMSDEPGSCTAVFLDSARDSIRKLQSLGMNTIRYGSAVTTGLAGLSPQTQDAIDAMEAGGQLSPAVAFVATNVIVGTGSLATEAAPYVVKTAGYGVAGGMDYVFGKALNDELNAIKKGQCKP